MKITSDLIRLVYFFKFLFRLITLTSQNRPGLRLVYRQRGDSTQKLKMRFSSRTDDFPAAKKDRFFARDPRPHEEF